MKVKTNNGVNHNLFLFCDYFGNDYYNNKGVEIMVNWFYSYGFKDIPPKSNGEFVKKAKKEKDGNDSES